MRFSSVTSKDWKQAEMISMIIAPVLSELNPEADAPYDASNIRRNEVQVKIRAIVYFVLNVLLIRVKDHMLNAAVRGKVRAFEDIDIEGRIVARPKIKKTLPVKSQNAG